MSADVYFSYLNRCPAHARLSFYVASQCAPVLKGIKASNMITMEAGTWRILRKAFQNSKVICIPLSLGKEKDVLLLYRYGHLAGLLKEEKVIRFLRGCGYDRMDAASVIIRLRMRYQEYISGHAPFPHELGVILEYPVEDVESFIVNGGKNCLLTRYWKVYHNKERAEEIFRLYDEARKTAIEEVLNGCPLAVIVENDGNR